MRLECLACYLLAVVSAQAHLGETPSQFADRYGAPKDSEQARASDIESPLLRGAIHHTYEHQGWRIRAAFLQPDGPAVRMEFEKLSKKEKSSVIKKDDLQAIVRANSPAGTSWKRVASDNADSPNKGLARVADRLLDDALGQKMWQRTDGALLSCTKDRIVRLELPAARQYEEQQKTTAQASAPGF